ncbi:hypothetical protein BU097_02470 [Staphylococcus xylosus]|uniref:Uncharacterized protein n=1 Tax=Staphylococcus xylosus TaxID=1288 RepID=A0A418IRC7_STAXY|nr:hypothetical protein [Staphylococcus xylosus]PTI58831.1 hypothetical protein BU103_03355 [Staphylococcus xylosus]RIN12412.1 hypothetical protein BU097_02470 [Staphylococcus xylosus]
MVKIKRKVEMTHEEYAKYLIDKFGIASYERELIDNNIFDAPMEFEQTFTLKSMRKDDDPVIERSFKGVVIEVEEEITEDTVFKHMIEVREGLTGHMTWENATIDSEKDNSSQEFHAYIDGKYELIWRNGKLVE